MVLLDFKPWFLSLSLFPGPQNSLVPSSPRFLCRPTVFFASLTELVKKSRRTAEESQTRFRLASFLLEALVVDIFKPQAPVVESGVKHHNHNPQPQIISYNLINYRVDIVSNNLERKT